MVLRLIDYFDRGASFNPARDCFIQGEQRITFAEVQRLSHRIGNALLSEGVSKGHQAAVFSPNDAMAFVCVLGILRACAAWVPINARSAMTENLHVLNDSGCELLFYHSSFEGEIEEIRKQVPGIRRYVCVDREGPESPFLQDWIANQQDIAPYIACDPQDFAAIRYTGGTTGVPKGVPLTHLNFSYMLANASVAMPYDEPPVYLAAAPMTHVAGAMSLMLLPHGTTIVVIDRPQPELVMEMIKTHSVTTVFLPPTAIYMLLAHPDVRNCDYSSLKYFHYAASPMSPDKLREAIDVFGPVMSQSYGQTESPFISTYFSKKDQAEACHDPDKSHRLRSAGRPSLFTLVEIMDDDGNILGAGDVGEIVTRGGIVMVGYYKRPDATQEVSAHGWHHTNDIGYKDEDGFIYIVDRKRDMIVSGGFNVWPSEIENVILTSSAVQDCAVIGVPDEKWGEAVKAVIELKPGRQISSEEIVAMCKDQLGSVKSPKSVEFWDELPRSAVGKVLKKDVRERFWAGHERRVG
ncbi:MAG: o-succinylbenzoate--CoA ligase [Thiotrichales bacterium]|nr:o-succinylbenzoate--CoA ligase [Thiotrichales bacterium]|tara:strand:+ start:1447 stop:3009 length:1563 start_codon:yes stop_codon:yes gene_type:complete